jgi:5-methylcytosine-specific restriction endonuclease McrBC GTP-binding regulatory subunit McrB
MKVENLIERLRTEYKPDETIAYSLWSVADVLEQARNDKRRVSRDEARLILEYVQDNESAETGINWSVLSIAIDNFAYQRSAFIRARRKSEKIISAAGTAQENQEG